MKKIIIDESFIGHLAREKIFLSRTDFSIMACSTKEQALKIHASEVADLILIDFDLPEMNIDNFCAHIRTNDNLKNVLTAIVSVNKMDNLDRCMMCGVDAIISKPVEHHEVIKTVTKLLKIRSREHTRVLVKISLVGKTTETFYATSHDISVGGMLIETGKEMEEGSSLSLSFYFRLTKISVKGKVVRKKAQAKNFFQYGISFIDIDRGSYLLIEDFIKMSKQSGKNE